MAPATPGASGTPGPGTTQSSAAVTVPPDAPHTGGEDADVASTERPTTSGPVDSNVTEHGTDRGSPDDEDASKTCVASGGTTTCWGTTRPEDSPTRTVVSTGASAGLVLL